MTISCGDETSLEQAPYQQTSVLDFVVEARDLTSGGDWTVVEKPTSTSRQQTITSLDPSHEYEFRVYAINEAGTSDWVTAKTLQSQLFNDEFETAYETAFHGNLLTNDNVAPSEIFDEILLFGDPTEPLASGSLSYSRAGVGTWTLAANGEYTFTPAEGFSGDTGKVLVGARIGDCVVYQLVEGIVAENTEPEPT